MLHRFKSLSVLVLILVAAPVAADELVRFTVPATASGIRGNSGATYHGLAHPRYRGNFTTSCVFTDPGLPGNVVMIANNGDTSFFTSTVDPLQGEDPDKDNHEVLVGRSVDGGDTFYFRRVLRWDDGRRMVRVTLVPDPSRNLVWTGTGQMYVNNPNSPGEQSLGTTRIEIDWATKKVRLLDQDLVGWDEYPVDKLNPPNPGFFTNIQFSHIAQVTVGGQTRFEAWVSKSMSPGPVPPCTNNSNYDTNLAKWTGPSGVKGRRIAWYRFDPSTDLGVNLGSEKLITSTPRTLPTAYPRSDMLVTRAELGNEEFLLVGTQEQIACTEVVNQNSDGGSIRFIKLAYNATTDNYNEVELDYTIDIASPSNPNWNCADSRVKCTSNTRNHYAMVSAVPYKNGTQMQLYVNAWGQEVPSFPQIGEAGTVQATHATSTVFFSKAYSDPVVFVQPVSYFGGQPAIARISNVTATSFQVRVQEDTGLDGSHALETLSWIVLERGTYRLSDRRVLEVDRVNVTATIPATTTWSSELDLKDSFGNDTGAVIFTQLQTMNDPYYAKTRHTGVPTIGNFFRCNPIGQCGNIRRATVSFGIEDDEAALRAGRQHGLETVGVLLIGEKWLGRSSSIQGLGPFGASGFDIRRVTGVPGVANGGWTGLTFELPKLGDLTNPILLAWSDTRNGGDPALMRYRNLTNLTVDLAMDEDQAFDSERNHTNETIVYWVFGKGSGEIRAAPISPDADQVF